jgi:serine/threonine protein kinase
MMTEKYVLSMGTRNNFLTRLFSTFQTQGKLYFMMECQPRGDLLSHIKKFGKFCRKRTLCYTAELFVGLQFLHSRGVIHRDIKLEKLLLDNEGHIKITDFGMSKLGGTATTFCGTPSYIAPEIIMGKTYGASADWWSFGLVIFQMLAGYSPLSLLVC